MEDVNDTFHLKMLRTRLYRCIPVKRKIMKATKFICNIVYVIFPFVTNGRK